MKTTPKTLLIIDDDISIHTLLRKYVVRIGNFRIISAYNGVSGLKKAKRLVEGIIFLDINMPRMDGLKVLKKLREDFKSKGFGLPVIMLTAHGDIDTIKKATELGIQGFIIKPFYSDTLLSKLKDMLKGVV